MGKKISEMTAAEVDAVVSEAGRTLSGELDGAVIDLPRPLSAIALDIEAHWSKVYFGAVPYLGAMHLLNKITDEYYADSAADIVRYFLSNATTWRGPDARRIKAELKGMLAHA